MNQDPEIKENFPKPPLVAYTRPLTIRQKLIRAKLPSRNVKPKRIINGMAKCKKNCKICPYEKSCKSIKATHTKMIVHLQKHHDCQTKNIIYLIKCKGAQNIGETQETLETRFSQHLGYVHRNEQDKANGKQLSIDDDQ